MQEKSKEEMEMQEQEHGGDIYSASYRVDYSVSVNPLGTPHSVRHAVMRSAGVLERYPDVKCRDLRRKLSDLLHLPAHWITCGNGAAELIYTVALARRPKKALVICPGFSEYEKALHTAGCGEILYYLCSRENEFRVEEDVLDLITEDVDMMYLCNPGNPTGILIRPELVLRILKRCTEKEVLLAADECFLEMTAHPGEHTLLGHVADNSNLIVLRSFTKTYAMPGVRLGYLVTSNRELIEKIRSLDCVYDIARATG